VGPDVPRFGSWGAHDRNSLMESGKAAESTCGPAHAAVLTLTRGRLGTESSINGSIPTADWSSCKSGRQERRDLRDFCRAL
jgi:hypothetical protein